MSANPPRDSGARCERDGQTLRWHLEADPHTGRTNGQFMGCDFGSAEQRDRMPDENLCSCGHTIDSHFAEPYCPACVGFPACDLDFAAWLAEHDRQVIEAAATVMAYPYICNAPDCSRPAGHMGPHHA